MLFPSSILLFITTFAVELVLSSPAQIPFALQNTNKPRKLHGRFLHITDMHPDPYYTPHSAESTSCHRKKSKKKKNIAGLYGTPYSECDSPFRLTNHTLDYLKDNWADEIDFVIWTGDNARHDNDRKLPRTPTEINDLNRAVAAKMKKIFTNRGIPVIPSLGNNDVWRPALFLNVFSTCPNSITNEFASIWNAFIPFPYLQVFQRGAYYAVDVIPDQLGVISLNTMYFYDSNKVVGGCAFKEPNDPGNLEIDWLEVQLEMFRERGMQVWISGHVPPSPGNYFPECYVRYVDLALRYQDIILGHLFGHMNVDHFFFLEAVDLEIFPDKKAVIRNDDEMEISGEGGLFDTLIEEFGALPKSPKLADYAVVNVAPSVVPNPFLPAFRVFSYNISDTAHETILRNRRKPKKPSKRKHGHNRDGQRNRTEHCRSEEYQDTWRCHLDQPLDSDPDSPSRRNQLFTPLGYAQYYAPGLAQANKTHGPQFELEYLTYRVEALHPDGGAEKGFQYPVPLRHLPEELREAGVGKSKYLPYKMRDLTIGSWIRLAREIADDKRRKLRKRFRKYMSVGGV
ncbi:hypothetical protein D9613_005070 [Agrocybe pediades]|uniref:Endopolyphosphatase n=1 Tax=Agrocybe pediades TaxID=84607 RepID=A0A8H4VRX1_9AGAR|nr:hypothetical protein D9613_005070 [Agrocybe pediades]